MKSLGRAIAFDAVEDRILAQPEPVVPEFLIRLAFDSLFNASDRASGSQC